MENYHGIENLSELGGYPLKRNFDRVAAETELSLLGGQLPEYLSLLQLKNGFYAFGAALHVFPYAPNSRPNLQEVVDWNRLSVWKYAYGLAEEELFAFSEDVFGYQFCFCSSGVGRFDPETGEVEPLCSTLNEWADLVAGDPETHLGYGSAKEWNLQKGFLRDGERLVPIYPFITDEGSSELTNLYAVDALKGMLSRADFARQIKEVPDGESVEIVPVIHPTRGVQ